MKKQEAILTATLVHDEAMVLDYITFAFTRGRKVRSVSFRFGRGTRPIELAHSLHGAIEYLSKIKDMD
jgi:hypothetical protein